MLSMIPPARGGWTCDEEWEISRVRALCRRYPQITMECGDTDEDDPWCIVYDKERQRIILHIARVDRWYVMVWPTQWREEKSRSIASALDAAEKGILWEIGIQLKALP
jgi:hypothetical protein